MKRRYQLIIILSAILFLSTTWDSWSYSLRLAGLIFLVSGSILWLVIASRTNQPFHLPKAVLPLIAFMLLQSLMLLRVPYPQYSIDLVLRQMVVLVFFLFCLDVFRQGWSSRVFENAIMMLAIIIAFLEAVLFSLWLINWFSISGSIFEYPPIHYRSSGLLLQHPNVLAGFLNLGYPFVLYNILHAKRSRKIFWAAILSLFLFVSYLTASRGGWVGLVSSFGLMIFLILIKRRKTLTDHLSFESIKRINSQYKVILISSLFLVLLAIPLLVNQLILSPRHGNWLGRVDLFAHGVRLFLDSPLLGSGPGSYAQTYMHAKNSVPGFSTAHAHSLIFQISAENGLIGLMLLVLGSLHVLGLHINSFRNRANESFWRSFIIYSGIACTILIHHFIDYLFGVTLYSLSVAGLVAVYLSDLRHIKKIAIPRKYFNLGIGLLITFILWGTIDSITGLDRYWQGAQETFQGNWSEAKNLLCEAEQEKPEFSLYAFQCGLASSFEAKKEIDSSFLSEAIASLDRGLEIDAEWPVHWANLAVVDWQSGDQGKALIEMRRAVKEAPQQPLFLINLGWMEENTGNQREAQRLYAHAVFVDPALANTYFFRKNPIRANSVRKGNKLVRLVNLIYNSDPLLNPSLLHTPQELSIAYIQSAKEDLAQKKPTEAWIKVKQAQFIDSSTSVLLGAADIARSLGREDAGDELIHQVLEGIISRNLSNQYYYVYYNRSSSLTDLSPFLITVELTPDFREELEVLIQNYRDGGNVEEADAINRWLTEQLLY